jgi:hypothetical protein
MANYTTDLHEIKRAISTFSKNITKSLNQVDNKFIMQMLYGLLKSSSTIISDVALALNEDIKRINTVKRLTRHLASFTNVDTIHKNYLKQIHTLLPDNPIVIVDDSDVIKPLGIKFESLGTVRDGSASTTSKNVYEKGYHICEMVALTKKEKQPVSLYSNIYSNVEENFESTNSKTLDGLNSIMSQFNKKVLFVFDRGFDNLAFYKHIDQNKHFFLTRIKETRNFKYKDKTVNVKELRDSRKGMIATDIWFNHKKVPCKISYLKVSLPKYQHHTMHLVLLYGLGKKPMMLLTNKVIDSKDAAISIVRAYMSRWRIEEYFRFKKQQFRFENFRVRSLHSIKTLNLLITIAIGFIGMNVEKLDKNLLSLKILEHSKSIKSKVYFKLYRFAEGIKEILAHAKCGISHFLNITKRKRFNQLSFIYKL